MNPVLDAKVSKTSVATSEWSMGSRVLPPIDLKPPIVFEADAKASPAAINVKVISKEEINHRMRAGESIQIVNVLDPAKYALGFIKGSKKIPLNELDARSVELDKSKPVVTYCSSRECNASVKAAERLSAKGFSVRAYRGGIQDWKNASLPMEA